MPIYAKRTYRIRKDQDTLIKREAKRREKIDKIGENGIIREALDDRYAKLKGKTKPN